MYHLKWPLMVPALLHLFICGQTSASNENVTVNTRKEIQHSESLMDEVNRYSILESNPILGIHNVTLLDSPQSLPGDMVNFSVLLHPHSEDRLATSSLLEPYDGFKYSPVSSTSISNEEHSNSTESMHVSSPSDLNDRKQLSFVHSSNISELPLSSKDVMEFKSTKPETSFKTNSSSHSNRKVPSSQLGRDISYTVLPDSYEQTAIFSASDSEVKVGLQTSASPLDNTSDLKREEAMTVTVLTTNMPITQLIQHTPVSHADSYSSSPPTSQITETANGSSDTYVSTFPVDRTMVALEYQNGTHNQQNEGRHSIMSKARSFQQLNNFTVSNSEPNNETDELVTFNGIDPSTVSATVIPPQPTSPVSIKNLKPTSGEGVQMTSLPNYHPNDVIHPSDDIHNISHKEKHPCARTCKEGLSPMVCRYRFELEWYYTMSKACYNCPLNLDDCNRKDCVVADGVRRPIVVVNRQMPGPSIEVCKGDHIIVDMENHMMEESTTIHWHGHHQRGTPYMDGVPYVTQCPIPPKSSFRYHYMADTPGTHFWHSHSGCQRADGVFGALVIRVPSSSDPHRDLYDHDLSEHIIQILDWDDKLGVAKFLAHHHANGNNKPKTLLVNGRGHFHRFQDVNSVTRNVTHSPTATFTVQQGFRYRFRLINAGFLNCPIELSVDNHTLLVISSDGTDVKPVEGYGLLS